LKAQREELRRQTETQRQREKERERGVIEQDASFLRSLPPGLSGICFNALLFGLNGI
jgi:hypothetical protein